MIVIFYDNMLLFILQIILQVKGNQSASPCLHLSPTNKRSRSPIHLCRDVNFPSEEVDTEKELNYDVVETKKVVKSNFVIDYNIAYSATHTM